MATVKEHVLLSHPDKQVLLSEIPAANPRDSSEPTVTLRLLVELCNDYGDGPVDVETMEDVTCRVPLSDMVGCQGAAAADRAFKDLVTRIGDPTLRPEVAAQTRAAAARVRERCGEEHDELGGVEFRLRVMFIDDTIEEEPDSDLEDEDEYGSDMEFGEFDLSGARNLHGQKSVAGYEDDDDDDEDGCGAQFSVRPYHGALVQDGETAPLLSGFEARSDGPELTEQDELTSYDIQRVVRKALDGVGSVEDDKAFQRTLAGGTPVSRASRAAMVEQALQSARPRSNSPRPIFPMRTGF